ncbi:MAG: hypothetical protein NXI30_18900 [bacterium]|nr:hypothetical protein [bacterium]
MASYDETGGYCGYCEKRVMVRRAGTNHILHLILTVLTAGLWLVIWAGSAIKAGGWRCPTCGSKASTRVPWKARKAGASG